MEHGIWDLCLKLWEAGCPLAQPAEAGCPLPQPAKAGCPLAVWGASNFGPHQGALRKANVKLGGLAFYTPNQRAGGRNTEVILRLQEVRKGVRVGEPQMFLKVTSLESHK